MKQNEIDELIKNAKEHLQYLNEDSVAIIYHEMLEKLQQLKAMQERVEDIRSNAKIIQRELAFPWGEGNVMSVVSMENAEKTAKAIQKYVKGEMM